MWFQIPTVRSKMEELSSIRPKLQYIYLWNGVDTVGSGINRRTYIEGDNQEE